MKTSVKTFPGGVHSLKRSLHTFLLSSITNNLLTLALGSERRVKEACQLADFPWKILRRNRISISSLPWRRATETRVLDEFCFADGSMTTGSGKFEGPTLLLEKLMIQTKIWNGTKEEATKLCGLKVWMTYLKRNEKEDFRIYLEEMGINFPFPPRIRSLRTSTRWQPSVIATFLCCRRDEDSKG